jgi:Domain of unknown function (DUF6265)
MNRNLLVVLLSLLVVFASKAQNAQPTSINMIAWLAGSWKGEAFGGEVEEIWSQPVGGTMMGMFRTVEKDKTSLSEFEQIVEQDSTLIFKVKHFTSAFVGWEEKDKCVEFRLLSSIGNQVHFDGLTWIKIDENTCKAIITLQDKATGKTRDVEIVYHRTKE